MNILEVAGSSDVRSIGLSSVDFMKTASGCGLDFEPIRTGGVSAVEIRDFEAGVSCCGMNCVRNLLSSSEQLDSWEILHWKVTFFELNWVTSWKSLLPCSSRQLKNSCRVMECLPSLVVRVLSMLKRLCTINDVYVESISLLL